VVASIEPFAGQEPTASYISEIIKLIKENNLNDIYKEPQMSDAFINSLSKDYGLKIKILDPIGGIDPEKSYLDTLLENCRVIGE